MTNKTSEQTTLRDQPDISAVVLRSLIVLSPLAAVGITWLAANRVLPGVAMVVMLLSGACAIRPDSHFGVLVVAIITIQWLAIVHNHTTPWSIAVAAALTIFHAAHAAATVAPITTAWTPAMRHRWARRAVALVLASAATWTIVAFAQAHRAPITGTILLTASLLVLAAGAFWARNGNTRRHPSE